MEYVVDLNKKGKECIGLVGGKGANLGEMLKSGFPVPRAFCITSDSYDDFIAQNNLQVVIDDYLKRIYDEKNNKNELACELMKIISEGKISDSIENSIKKYYKSFGDNVRVAVRSSATAEDLPNASFAGQQETYLNVCGEKLLISKIKECFASLWTERAIAYRKENGFDKEKIHLAGVVQEMVEGDISGVLFTVNPTNKNKNQIMINSSYGLGEAIVSGKVTPDTIIWDRKAEKVINKVLGDKEISILYGKSGGTIEVNNSEEQKKKFSITENQAMELVKVAEKIEKHYGYPQDIEWAIKDNHVYILQARGITTLKNINSDSDEKLENQGINKQSKIIKKVIDNLIEHYPEPIYPLEFAPVSIVMNGKIKVFNELGIKMKDQIEMLNDGVLSINASSTKISPKIIELPFKMKQFKSYSENIKQTDKVFSSINNKLSKIEEKLQLNNKEFRYLDENKINKILSIFKDIMDMTKDIIYVRFRYNIFPSVLISKSIRSKLKKIRKDMTEFDTLSDLKYKTIEMNDSLENLASIVKNNQQLYKDIMSLKGIGKEKIDYKLEEIALENKEFGKAYKKLIDQFGWKSLNGYQAFSTVSWNEDKSKMLTLLYIYITGNKEKDGRNKYKEICNSIRNKFSVKSAEKLLENIEQIRVYHVNREESLYMLERCYGIARKILQQISEEYPHIFKVKNDILYLTLDEVYSLPNSTEDRLIKMISLRKKSRMKNTSLWNSVDLNVSSDEKYLLTGTSGNQGKYKGKVCIIKDVTEFEKLEEGDVLVCKYTDPSWTPLFTLAKAVVSDTGGPLSHSAIVAREYNIPAVLGCGNATTVLNDGDEVIVDGNEGKVRIIEA